MYLQEHSQWKYPHPEAIAALEAAADTLWQQLADAYTAKKAVLEDDQVGAVCWYMALVQRIAIACFALQTILPNARVAVFLPFACPNLGSTTIDSSPVTPWFTLNQIALQLHGQAQSHCHGTWHGQTQLRCHGTAKHSCVAMALPSTTALPWHGQRTRRGWPFV